VLWKALLYLIEPYYPKASSKGGQPPYQLEKMLRIHLLQQLHDLSDPEMEDALIEVAILRCFVGIALISDQIPDESTILAFRHLLEQQNLGEEIVEAVKAHLKANGMAMRQVSIVDATIIEAPSSTKNKAGERDPERHQAKKRNQLYFGMKVHLGVDSESGLIHSVGTTAANVHDLSPAAELLNGEETMTFGCRIPGNREATRDARQRYRLPGCRAARQAQGLPTTWRRARHLARRLVRPGLLRHRGKKRASQFSFSIELPICQEPRCRATSSSLSTKDLHGKCHHRHHSNRTVLFDQPLQGLRWTQVKALANRNRDHGLATRGDRASQKQPSELRKSLTSN
jgi:IS5 family transposase